MAADPRHKSRPLLEGPDRAVARGHMFDGTVTISGCDKTIPAMGMVLGRLDIPGITLYGGSIASGACARPNPMRGDRKLAIQDAYEALGAFNAGKITAEEFKDVEDDACSSAGACGGQLTANTVATAYEMLGIAGMGWNDVPAMNPAKGDVAFECGKLVVELVRAGVTPRSLVTRRSFENAITGVMATGGSTNAVLHLLATAHEFGVPLSIEDFDRISRQTPVLADLRPWGAYTAPEMYEAVERGPVGALRDGDTIVIDVERTRLDVELTDTQIQERTAAALHQRRARQVRPARRRCLARRGHRPRRALIDRFRSGYRGVSCCSTERHCSAWRVPARADEPNERNQWILLSFGSDFFD